jgi:AraC family transcriptional activator of pobA
MNIQERCQTSAFNAELKLKGFRVYEIDNEANTGHTYSRKDFYKNNLTTGKFIFHYADRSFEQEGTVLFFGNPHILYSW